MNFLLCFVNYYALTLKVDKGMYIYISKNIRSSIRIILSQPCLINECQKDLQLSLVYECLCSCLLQQCPTDYSVTKPSMDRPRGRVLAGRSSTWLLGCFLGIFGENSFKVGQASTAPNKLIQTMGSIAQDRNLAGIPFYLSIHHHDLVV